MSVIVNAPSAAGPAASPPGLRYVPDFVSAESERLVLARIAELPEERWRRPETLEFEGRLLGRRSVFFGWGPYRDAPRWERAAPLPDWLEPIRARCEEVSGLATGALEQAVVVVYPPGVGTPANAGAAERFGSHVFVVTLGEPARVMFRSTNLLRHVEYEDSAALEDLSPYVQLAEPRSMYVISGAARREWTHEVLYEYEVPTAQGDRLRGDRVAITFRSPAPPSR